jgi:hypothetical protein
MYPAPAYDRSPYACAPANFSRARRGGGAREARRRLSGAWVGLRIGAFEAFDADMRVDLGG